MVSNKKQPMADAAQSALHAGQNLAGNRLSMLRDQLLKPSKAWHSRLSWRITLSIFAALILIQFSIQHFTVLQFKAQKIDDLRTVVLYTVQGSLLKSAQDAGTMPLDVEKTEYMLNITPIRGIEVYGMTGNLIASFGLKPSLTPADIDDGRLSLYSKDAKTYQSIYPPIELSRPYTVITISDAAPIENFVNVYNRNAGLINILMSGLITSILMLALSLWVLEPVMQLCDNLTRIAEDPSLANMPEMPGSDMPQDDEIGGTLKIANDLIRKNARNVHLLRQKAETKINQLAYYDTLTNLPNRTYFLEKLGTTIKQKVLHEGKTLLVMVVDLDHFKDINDTMGYEMGDKLLDIIGKRLVKASPNGAIVARSSANEFSVMTVLDDDGTSSSSIIENIFTSIQGSVRILNEHLRVTASIGVTHCPNNSTDPAQLLRNASIALHRAKSEGRETVCHYSEDFNVALQKRFQMLRDLRGALDDDNLRLQFHPQFNMKTGKLVGAEALLRLWRPDGSKDGGQLTSPQDIMNIVGQSGLMIQIGEWVLRNACRTAKMWQDRGLPPICISVNVTGVQFHRGDIVDNIELILKETGLEPKWLEIEVTENVFMNDMENAIETIRQLHALGVAIAIDDFGTGYSSLNYLRQLSIDQLKIDQVFIRNALVSENDKMITRTIISLGHSLGLKVLAEGVETSDHEAFLKEEGCDEVQGFKYTRPLLAEKFWDFAVAHNKTTGGSA